MEDHTHPIRFSPAFPPSRLGRILRWVEWEALIWLAGLAHLARSDPQDPGHFTLYPPALLFGIRSPGYNLGHSVSFLLHGQWQQSLQAHPLGFLALVVLATRIIQLIRRMIHTYPIVFKGE